MIGNSLLPVAVLAWKRRRPLGSHIRPRVRGFLVGSVVYKSRARATKATLVGTTYPTQPTS